MKVTGTESIKILKTSRPLVLKSDGFLKMDKAKLSRFERGDIAFDDITTHALKVYLEEKLSLTSNTLNLNNEEIEEEIKNDGNDGNGTTRENKEEHGESSSNTSSSFSASNNEHENGSKRVQTLVKQSKYDIGNILKFSNEVGEVANKFLIDKYFELASQLETAMDSNVETGFFGGFTEQTEDDARACIYTMAGMLNIIFALQGKMVFPIQDNDESILPGDNILSVLQGEFFTFTGQGPSNGNTLKQEIA